MRAPFFMLTQARYYISSSPVGDPNLSQVGGRLQRRASSGHAGGDADTFATLSCQHYRRLLNEHPSGEAAHKMFG